MLNINKLNYEIYFIDYIDGTLDSEQEKELFLFLEKHPELQSEFDSLKNIPLETKKIIFCDKENLLKNNLANNNSESNFSDLCIARIEGDMPEKEIEEFDKLVNESGKNKNEYQLFLKTINKANTNISFPDKNKLLKSGKVEHSKIRYLYRYSSIAASIILLVSFWFLLPENTDNNFAETKMQNTGSIQVKENKTIQKDTKNKKKSITKKNNYKNINNINTNNKKVLHKEKLKIIKPNIRIQINEPIIIAKAKKIKIENTYNSDIAELRDVNLNSSFKNDATTKKQSDFKNHSIIGYLSKTAAKKIRNKTNVNKIKSLQLWDIADTGIKVINSITGSNIKFEQKQDKKGKTKAIHLETKYFALNTPIKN